MCSVQKFLKISIEVGHDVGEQAVLFLVLFRQRVELAHHFLLVAVGTVEQVLHHFHRLKGVFDILVSKVDFLLLCFDVGLLRLALGLLRLRLFLALALVPEDYGGGKPDEARSAEDVV